MPGPRVRSFRHRGRNHLRRHHRSIFGFGSVTNPTTNRGTGSKSRRTAATTTTPDRDQWQQSREAPPSRAGFASFPPPLPSPFSPLPSPFSSSLLCSILPSPPPTHTNPNNNYNRSDRGIGGIGINSTTSNTSNTSNSTNSNSNSMQVRQFSVWLIMSATASTGAFAPRSPSSSQPRAIQNKTCSANGSSGAGACPSATPPTARLSGTATGDAEATEATTNDTTTDTTTDTNQPVEIFRGDYKPLELVVSKINMDLDICDDETVVTSELFIEKNPGAWAPGADLVLDGDETSVALVSIELDGRALAEGEDYTLGKGTMVVKNPPPGSVLRTVVTIVPEENTQLSGLYKSGPMYCTQCEAMGFRRITYYPDRPDNVSRTNDSNDSNEQSTRTMDEWIDGWIDGSIDGWMDRWMDAVYFFVDVCVTHRSVCF